MSSLALMLPPDPGTPPIVSASRTVLPFARSIFLQISHRAGIVSLLSTLATWALLYLSKDATAETGLASALLARLITPATDRREANGSAIFNLVLLVLGLYLMVFLRIGQIHSAGSKFFNAPSSQASISR
jgi:hypothetical protein